MAVVLKSEVLAIERKTRQIKRIFIKAKQIPFRLKIAGYLTYVKLFRSSLKILRQKNRKMILLKTTLRLPFVIKKIIIGSNKDKPRKSFNNKKVPISDGLNQI